MLHPKENLSLQLPHFPPVINHHLKGILHLCDFPSYKPPFIRDSPVSYLWWHLRDRLLSWIVEWRGDGSLFRTPDWEVHFTGLKRAAHEVWQAGHLDLRQTNTYSTQAFQKLKGKTAITTIKISGTYQQKSIKQNKRSYSFDTFDKQKNFLKTFWFNLESKSPRTTWPVDGCHHELTGAFNVGLLDGLLGVAGWLLLEWSRKFPTFSTSKWNLNSKSRSWQSSCQTSEEYPRWGVIFVKAQLGTPILRSNSWGSQWLDLTWPIYHLVMTNIAMENHHF